MERKDAIEIIKKNYPDSSFTMLREALETLIPELAESEYERIRKGIIRCVKGNMPDNDFRKKYVEWLEQQSEHKPAEWSEKYIADVFEKVGLAKIAREQGYDNLTNALQSAMIELGKSMPQQNHTWSEEDKEMLDTLIANYKFLCKEFRDKEHDFFVGMGLVEEDLEMVNWLKSLKDRIQLQNTITDEELAQAKKDAYNDALDKIEYHSGEPTFDDGWSAAIWYLKKRNVQPQSTWKPSDKQMEVLKEACDEHWEPDGLDPLYTLYEDLKKLK